MGVFILIRRPFDNWIENTTLIISNLCYTVVLILFLIVDTKTSLTPAERYHNLGTPIVGFIIAIIVITRCRDHNYHNNSSRGLQEG